MKDIRVYLRERLSSLGYSEWRDEKNVENVPRSKLESIFHIEMSSADTIKQNQVDLVLQIRPVVSLFKIGLRDTSGNADECFDIITNVIKAVTKSSLALTQSNIKLIRADNFSVEEADVSNDNIFLIKIVFYVEYIININS